MSPEAVTAERIYGEIKTAVLRGQFFPGEVLNVHRLSELFGVSISPLRDGLHRLIGERLIHSRPGGGFQLPPASVSSVRDLYIWHESLVQRAISRGEQSRTDPDLTDLLAGLDPEDSIAVASLSARVFDQIGGSGDSIEALIALRSAGERLNAIRMQESVIPDRTAELQQIWGMVRAGAKSQLRTAVTKYHRRRLRRIRALIVSLNNTGT